MNRIFIIKPLFFLFFVFPSYGAAHRNCGKPEFPTRISSLAFFSEMEVLLPADTLSDSLQKRKHKKFLPAILAFPVPFGIFGGHRIYLGTKPYVPFVYIATLGGALALSLADFIAILRADDEKMKRFQNNSRVFMWVQ